jgi:hypothetical protein
VHFLTEYIFQIVLSVMASDGYNILRFCLVYPISKKNVNPKIYNALSGELVRSK